MKKRLWRLILGSVIALTLISFLALFDEGKMNPTLGPVPYSFWVGFLVTVLVVGLTFLASRFSPFQEDDKR